MKKVNSANKTRNTEMGTHPTEFSLDYRLAGLTKPFPKLNGLKLTQKFCQSAKVYIYIYIYIYIERERERDLDFQMIR